MTPIAELVQRLRSPPIVIKHGGYAEGSSVELDQFEVLTLLAKSADTIERLADCLEYCRAKAEWCRLEPEQETHGSDPFAVLLQIELEVSAALSGKDMT